MSDNTPKKALERKPALLLAEFDSPQAVVNAAKKVRDAGYKVWDTHTPYPIHGMDDAMGMKDTPLGFIIAACGITGTSLGFAMMMWMNGHDYPIVIGGKPPDSIPSMIPIMFELTILLSGFAAVFGMLGMNKLPRHHHPIFASERFARATDDRFFVSIEAADPQFDVRKTHDLLASTHPTSLELIEEEA